MQIVGGYLDDRTTLAFAGFVEREFGGFTAPPIPSERRQLGARGPTAAILKSKKSFRWGLRHLLAQNPEASAWINGMGDHLARELTSIMRRIIELPIAAVALIAIDTILPAKAKPGRRAKRPLIAS